MTIQMIESIRKFQQILFFLYSKFIFVVKLIKYTRVYYENKFKVTSSTEINKKKKES
jgi:hypothetical protein